MTLYWATRMVNIIQSTAELLIFSWSGSTYFFTPNGKYRCENYKKDDFSCWKIENNSIYYSHVYESEPKEIWYHWKYKEAENVILSWLVDSIILENSRG